MATLSAVSDGAPKTLVGTCVPPPGVVHDSHYPKSPCAQRSIWGLRANSLIPLVLSDHPSLLTPACPEVHLPSLERGLPLLHAIHALLLLHTPRVGAHLVPPGDALFAQASSVFLCSWLASMQESGTTVLGGSLTLEVWLAGPVSLTLLSLTSRSCHRLFLPVLLCVVRSQAAPVQAGPAIPEAS